MQDLIFSFEFFPPKTPKMEEKLWATVDRLAPLNPEFVSVTYGAGGSTRARTHETVTRIQDDRGLSAAAHLTCVEATRGEVDEVLRAYWDAGVRHIVALRGDPPSGVGGKYVPTKDGYANAAELAAGAKSVAPFEISVGCYPEKHPESESFDHDIDLLKQKIDNGATRAITQFFYDNEVYFRFLDRVQREGIDIPIVPGIMPVANFNGLKKMASMCGASIPSRMVRLFDNLDDDPDTHRLVAATVAAEQCLALAEQGVRHFHFYTLNRARLAYALCYMLGARPSAPPAT